MQQLQPGRLTGKQMLAVHEAALEILRDPGLEVEFPVRVLDELAAQEGVTVDAALGRVRLASAPVLETVRQLCGAAEAGIDVHGSRKPAQPLRFPNRISAMLGAHYGTILDLDGTGPRPTTHDDVRNFIKLRQALPGVVKTNVGLVPSDVPQAVAYVRAMALSAKYQPNAAGMGSTGLRDGAWIGRIQEVLGARPKGQAYRRHVWTTPPLRLCGESAAMLLEQVTAGRLTRVHSSNILGGSGPVTVAGTLAVSLAETFGFNTLARLLCPPPENQFRPQALSVGGVGLMDPRKGTYCLARPEVLLVRRAFGQMAGEFYKVPRGMGFNVLITTDAAVPGMQAAMEKAICLCTEVSAGFHSYDEDVVPVAKPIGTLQAETYICAEQAVIDNEMVQWVRRFLAGTAVDDDSLALDAVRQVGPGGVFMQSDHAVGHCRQAVWAPELLREGPWRRGEPALLDEARQKVREIFARPLEPVLPEDRLREIESLVRQAEQDLLGRTTGVPL